jgi:hypothetical protein
MGRPFFRKKVILTTTAGIALLVLFQNCSDARLGLIPKSERLASVRESSGSRLPMPKIIPGDLRVVIVLDQSFSMVWGKCPADLDGIDPSPTGAPFNSCARSDGVDKVGHRYDVVQQWISDLQNLSRPENDIKIMLLPFSGGKAARPKTSPGVPHGLLDGQQMRFLTLSQAGAWLQALRQEQTAMIADGSREIMGTTVFAPILEYARAQMVGELTRLAAQNKVPTTPFEFVFITDGAYKPTLQLFNLAREVSGCPDCDANPSHLACTCFSSGCSSGSEPPGVYCSNLESRFRTYLGSENNNITQSQDLLNSILNLDGDPAFLGLRLNMRFSKVNWNSVPDEDKNSGTDITKNLFDEIQLRLSEEIPVFNISSSVPPFPIPSRSPDLHSFVIKNFHVYNQNAYVDRLGNLILDSDGDGLSDSAELANGFDPQNPRTNGFCLDGLANRFGCQMLGCRPHIDADGDGLNECEEITIGSNPNLFDTENDGIPDLLEALRHLNPNVDDSRIFSSGDNNTDHAHFRMGVVPALPIEGINPRKIIQMTMKFLGFDLVQDEFGINASVARYFIELKNAPVVNTKSVPAGNTISLKKTEDGPPIPLLHRLDSTSKMEGVNSFLFLLQINTVENPNEISWHLKKVDVVFNNTDGTYKMNTSFKFEGFEQISGRNP